MPAGSFVGGLNAANYMTISGLSATTTRDLAALVGQRCATTGHWYLSGN